MTAAGGIVAKLGVLGYQSICFAAQFGVVKPRNFYRLIMTVVDAVPNQAVGVCVAATDGFAVLLNG